MKRLIILGLGLATFFAVSPAQAQTGRCLPSEIIIAKARAERPSTEVVARHTGLEAAALLDVFGSLAEDADATEGDEVTILRSSSSDEVLVIVGEEGCALWRVELSRSDYEHATWKAFGLPI